MVMLYKAKDIEKLKSQHQKELNKLKESQQGWKDARDRLDIMYDSLKLENQKLKKELNDLKEVLPELKLVVKKLNKAFNLKEKRCIK